MRRNDRRRVIAAASAVMGELTGRTVSEARVLLATIGAQLQDIGHDGNPGRKQVYVYVRVANGRVARVLSVS